MAFLDGGSDHNLISREHVGDTPLGRCDYEMKAINGTSMKVYGWTSRLMRLTDDFGTTKEQVVVFDVVDMDQDIILGIPWHTKAQVQCTWGENFWNYPLSFTGQEHCISSTKQLQEAKKTA